MAALPPADIRSRAAALITGAAVLVTAAALLSLAIGYHPSIVRSGSMEPSLHVGDIVLMHDVPADALQAGDIATIGRGRDGGTTHRVVKVEVIDDQVLVQTRGDANPTGEHWTLGATERVGRVAHRMPYVGLPFAWMINGVGRLHLAGTAVTVVLVAVVATLWRRPGER